MSTMRWRDFPEFIITMFEEIFEEKLWSLYLASPFQSKNFNEYKDEMLEKSKPKELVESESQKAAESALSMLEKFGGEDFGI